MSGTTETITPAALTTAKTEKVELFKGELVDVKNGRFRVDSIGRKVMLEPMPKTYVESIDPINELRLLADRIHAMNEEHQRVVRILMAIVVHRGGKIDVTDEAIDAIAKDDVFRLDHDLQLKVVSLAVEKAKK